MGEEDEDLTLIGMALAQRSWVEARLRDWLQLAPSLRIRPEAGVRVVLLCPDFRPQTRLAARALGPRAIGLVRYRCVADGTGMEALVEHLIDDDDPADEAPPTPDRAPPPDRVAASAPDAAPQAEPGPEQPFRSGLTDADLGLDDDERAEFA